MAPAPSAVAVAVESDDDEVRKASMDGQKVAIDLLRVRINICILRVYATINSACQTSNWLLLWRRLAALVCKNLRGRNRGRGRLVVAVAI